MIRILFVHGDAHLLANLRQLLRHHRDRWEMTFSSSSGDAALNLARTDHDVVVADISMPGTDGPSFLAEVRDSHPNALRIVLGDALQGPGAIGSLPIGHHFLSTPCDPAQLEAAVERSMLLRSRLTDPVLRTVVGGMACLPSPSTTVLALQAALMERPVDPVKVADIISDDVAISTKVLQVANSAYFGLPRPLIDPFDAVTYLGASAIGELVLCGEIFRSAGQVAPSLDTEVERIQIRSTMRADLAAALTLRTPRRAQTAREIWTAAFLADVGQLVLLGAPPAVRDAFVPADPECPDELFDPSSGLYAATIAAHLISLWGLPHHLVESVALGVEPPAPHGSDGAAFTWIARRAIHGGDRVVSDHSLAVVGLTRAALQEELQGAPA